MFPARRIAACLTLAGVILGTPRGGLAAPSPAEAATAVSAADDGLPDETEPIAPAVVRPDPAGEKFWQAVRLLESKKTDDVARGRRLLQEAADLEYSHAQVQLANCLVSGTYGFAKNPRKAAALFRLAAERGNAFAKVSLGQCLVSGTGVRRDAKQARVWLAAALAPDADFSRPSPPPDHGGSTRMADEVAAVAGELASDPISRAQASAHFLLGSLCSDSKQAAEAQAHYVAAATAGPAGREGLFPAAVMAALNFAFGQGVPRDLAAANDMLERSRKLANRMQVAQLHSYVGLKQVDEFAVGDLEQDLAEQAERMQSELQVKIAATFANPKSKEYNRTEAAKWFRLAADNEQPWAMLALGLMEARGELGPADPAAAFGWFEKAGRGPKPKHLLAAANLALCHLHGFGITADRAKAEEIFQRFRDRDFICYLGSIGQAPAKVVAYDEALALNETWAKTKKDRHAQYLLGLRFFNGWGVPADTAKAMAWLTKAADAGDPAACGFMGFYLRSSGRDLPRALEYFAKGRAAGDARSAVGLGLASEFGAGRMANHEEAIALYDAATKFDPDFAVAHEKLAALLTTENQALLENLHSGIIPAGSEAAHAAAALQARILHHWAEAERLESERAPYALGMLALEGKLQDQDLGRAYALLETAAERGSADAHYQLGLLHETGRGVPITYTEAAYHYRLAALDGHHEALRRLSAFYLTGKGVSQDLDRAQFWLSLLARTGDNRALVAFGDLAMRKADYALAVRIWRSLDKSGDHYLIGCSAERLSRCYRDGLGVKRDAERAKKLFARAMAFDNDEALVRTARERLAAGNVNGAATLLEMAATNSSEAAFELGRLFFFGGRIARDEAKAWKLLRQAAAADQADALYFLATTTYQHVPGAPSLEEAIRFAQVAEATGYAKAAKLREQLELQREQPNAPASDEFAPPRPV